MNNQKVRGRIAIIGLIILLISLIFLISRQLAKNINQSGVNVVTSFYPLGYLAQELVGNRGSVTIITPAGAEPHDYELTPENLIAIQRSNIVVLNGNIEAWAKDIQDSIAGSSTKLVVAGDGLMSQRLTAEGKEELDPHVWLDPVLVIKEVARITDALIAVDPQNRSEYLLRNEQLITKLSTLDSLFRDGLKNCARRDFVTSHLAFSYLAKEYNLNQVGIAGLSPEDEPSPSQMSDVAKFVKENHVKTIFFESLVSPKLAQSIAQETGATTAELNPLEGLTADQVANGETYVTIMERNLANLQTALECQK